MRRDLFLFVQRKNQGRHHVCLKFLRNVQLRKQENRILCTVFKDENWIEIRKYFENKGNDLRIFTSMEKIN